MNESCRYFDTHVHLDLPGEKGNLPQELHLARQSGVGQFLVPGVKRSGWPDLMQLCRSHEGLFAAPGLHPMAADQWNGETRRELESLLCQPKVVAIGEIGLDATLPSPALPQQEAAFTGQLRLAVEAGLPVLIHCRRATGRLLEILRRENARRVGGILHAFSGSLEVAREAVSLGFAIGVSGSVTFANARRLPQVVRHIEPDWLVLETDAPDMAPHPHRGEANRPAWLPLVAAAVAELRGWELEQTAGITTANARRVLRLPAGG